MAFAQAILRFPRVNPSYFFRRSVSSHPGVRRYSSQAMAAVGIRSDSELIDAVITHWFGKKNLGRLEHPTEAVMKWFLSTPEADKLLEKKFGKDVERGLSGELDHLMSGKDHPFYGELALIVLLDQFPRNIFRGTGRAFAGDAKSRDIVMSLLEPEKWPLVKRELPFVMLTAFILPLMHQESIEDVTRACALAKELAEECEVIGEDAEGVAKGFRMAEKSGAEHLEIIARFGRYPYRNKALGRESTLEEAKFLESKSTGFGQ